MSPVGRFALTVLGVAVAIPIGLFATGFIGTRWVAHTEKTQSDEYHNAVQRMKDGGIVQWITCGETTWVTSPSRSTLSVGAMDAIRKDCGGIVLHVNVTDSNGNVLQTDRETAPE